MIFNQSYFNLDKPRFENIYNKIYMHIYIEPNAGKVEI